MSRDENGLTLKEERELKWAEENEAQEALGLDKVQMRQYYKVSQGGEPERAARLWLWLWLGLVLAVACC